MGHYVPPASQDSKSGLPKHGGSRSLKSLGKYHQEIQKKPQWCSRPSYSHTVDIHTQTYRNVRSEPTIPYSHCSHRQFLVIPHEHLRGWRPFTYRWLYLLVTIISRPFSEETRNHTVATQAACCFGPGFLSKDVQRMFFLRQKTIIVVSNGGAPRNN